MPGNIEWYNECRNHAEETDSLESFKTRVFRVGKLAGSLGEVHWFRPMCHSEPTQLEFSAGKWYGCIAIHSGNWSINT